MKSFKSFIGQLNETLTPKQRRWVDNRSNSYARGQHDNLFRNPPEGATKIDDDTFTMPVSPVDKTRENKIRDHLGQHGYTVHDYVGDHITDRHGRTTSIGKALGKTKQDPNLYATDPRIRNRDSGEISGDTHEIMISRHPYHVGGMSSGRNWNSCMTLPGDERNRYGGQYHKKVAEDLNKGTLIAYLIKKGIAKPNTELDKDEALSRILLKRFDSPEGSSIFRAERNSYSPAYQGSSREKYPQFEKAVKNFGETQWKGDENSLHFKNDNLYNDDGVSVATTKEVKDYSPEQLHSYAKHIEDLELKYEDGYTKDPDNLHHHRMVIASHPNTSAKTLSKLVPDEDGRYRYDRYNDKSYNSSYTQDNAKGELLDTIAEHKNVAADTLHEILKNHEDDLYDSDEVKTKLLSHPDADADMLEHYRGNSDEHDLLIANHPNTSENTLQELYKTHSDEGGDNDVIRAIGRHKNTSESIHQDMLNDIKNGNYSHSIKDENIPSHLLQNIARRSKDPEILHNVALTSDENHPDHHIIQRLLAKNPNTEPEDRKRCASERVRRAPRKDEGRAVRRRVAR